MKIVAPPELVKKIQKVIKRYHLISSKDRILLAVSGGKDSITMLYLFSILKNKYNLDFEIIFVDLGIYKFSEESLKVVEKHAKRLNVKLNVVRLKDYGFTLMDIAKRIDIFKGRSVCGICSTIKRYLIHKFAVDKGFNKIATAHTLEDFARFILDFYIDGDIKVLTRAYPITKSEVTNIYFIKPLFLISEKLTKKFVEMNKLEIVRTHCPFSKKNLSRNLRIIEEMEKIKPGSVENLVKVFVDKVYPILSKEIFKRIRIKKCKICGMPASRDICSFCRIRSIFDKKFRK